MYGLIKGAGAPFYEFVTNNYCIKNTSIIEMIFTLYIPRWDIHNKSEIGTCSSLTI